MADIATDTSRAAETITPAGIAIPVDTSASRIEWTAAKVTRTHEGGFREFAGVVYLDGEVVTGADITAQTASIYSDVPRLTEHLKSDDFFDATANPEVRFLVTEVTPVAETDTSNATTSTHQASGTLTMHGRSNRVTFPVTLAFADGTVTADADFIINRQDWGISYTGAPDDLVRDEVRVRLHVVAASPRTP